MTLRILVVDDNPTFTAAVRLMLEQLPGVSIVGQAGSGQEALALDKTTLPELVLLDIAMPGMNGLEVAQQLRNSPHRPAIVFLSSCELAAYSEATCRLGALACVDKADLVAELLPILEGLCASRLSQKAACPLPV